MSRYAPRGGYPFLRTHRRSIALSPPFGRHRIGVSAVLSSCRITFISFAVPAFGPRMTSTSGCLFSNHRFPARFRYPFEKESRDGTREGAALSAPMAARTEARPPLSALDARITSSKCNAGTPRFGQATIMPGNGNTRGTIRCERVSSLRRMTGRIKERSMSWNGTINGMVLQRDGAALSEPDARNPISTHGRARLCPRRWRLFVAESPKKSSEITAFLGMSRVYGNLARCLRALLDDKLIELTIPEKPKSRLQKYRLTRKGREIAKRLASLRGAHGGAPSHAHQCR